MTDATSIETGTVGQRTFAERLGAELREAMAAIARIPQQLGIARDTYTAEHDFDSIHSALYKLNNRQLAMMGLKRDEIYTFTELCVYQPTRRPVLQLDEAGPALSLPAPDAAKALASDLTEADAEVDEKAEVETIERQAAA